MDSLRRYANVTGLALGLALLAACGADATATLQPLATFAPTAIPRSGTVAVARTTGMPTALTTARGATATPAGAPVAAATRTVPAGVVTPPQAVTKLQQLGNARQGSVELCGED